MGKATKKRKDKAADFSKSKLKLGKGKQLASNAIDTSFKARSIALPTQSITRQKDTDAPTTKRKLSLDDLITHLKHYNAGTRKDSILGMKELLGSYPELIELHLAMIINACVRLIADEDAQVRKTLFSFFAWLLPQIPKEVITPYSSTILLFTSSAQTHIFPEIRVDAITFLTLLLDFIPETVVSGWNERSEAHGSRILEGYLGLLNAGTKFGDAEGPVRATSTASVVLTPASRLIVLQSLSLFLRHAISPPPSSQASTSTSHSDPSQSGLPTWYFQPSFLSQDAFNAFHHMLQPLRAETRAWKLEADDIDDDFVHDYPLTTECAQSSLYDLADTSNSILDIEPTTDNNVQFLSNLAQSMHAIIQSTFLDFAPTVFSPSANPPETDLKLVLAVAEISRNIYTAILQDDCDDEGRQATLEMLNTLLGYMAPYFPFTPSGKRDVKVEQSFQELNLIYCELCSLLTITSQLPSSSYHARSVKLQRKPRSTKNKTQQINHTSATVQVRSYASRLLRGEATSDNLMGKPLTPTTYSALLPTLWSLLNTGSVDDDTQEFFDTLVEHCTRTSSKAAVKKHSVEFIARIILVQTEPEYKGAFRIASNHTEVIEGWVLHLPKTLWELGAHNITLTAIILQFILRAIQHNSPFFSNKVVTSLQSRLIPFFSSQHPTRGLLTGPFCKLPSFTEHDNATVTRMDVRRVVLDVTFMLLRGSALSEVGMTLIEAVDRAVEHLGDHLYWDNLKKLL